MALGSANRLSRAPTGLSQNNFRRGSFRLCQNHSGSRLRGNPTNRKCSAGMDAGTTVQQQRPASTQRGQIVPSVQSILHIISCTTYHAEGSSERAPRQVVRPFPETSRHLPTGNACSQPLLARLEGLCVQKVHKVACLSSHKPFRSRGVLITKV